MASFEGLVKQEPKEGLVNFSLQESLSVIKGSAWRSCVASKVAILDSKDRGDFCLKA
jgi:hypothetical protein